MGGERRVCLSSLVVCLVRLYERALDRPRGEQEQQRRKRKINPCLIFSLFYIFSPFTSFQAESLLVRRKVWRGNERGGGGGGGGGGGEEDEEGREAGR